MVSKRREIARGRTTMISDFEKFESFAFSFVQQKSTISGEATSCSKLHSRKLWWKLGAQGWPGFALAG